MKLARLSVLMASLAAGLVVISARAELAYGPDTCRQGYVWREAFPGDHVCVTPKTRAQAAHDNGQANARREPGGGAYGPDTCRPGYVWREARPDDHVCVTPETRARAAADNRQAAARRASASTDPATQTNCEGYARHAIREYELMINDPRCRINTDARWQPSYENHYNWCLTAPSASVRAEEQARDDHLYRCRFQ
jgi:hypothetical protein